MAKTNYTNFKSSWLVCLREQSNDDKVCTKSTDIATLLKLLEQKSEKGIELFKKTNEMIDYQTEFQTMAEGTGE